MADERDAVAELAPPLMLEVPTPVVAPSVAGAPSRLGVMMGDQRWLVDLAEAGEVVPLPEITPVPLTAAWLRGLVNLRGNLVTVVDLLAYQGLGETPLGKESRLLALGSRVGVNSALLITRMLGLRGAQWSPANPEQSLAMQAPWMGAPIVDPTGLVWRDLYLSVLARDRRFLSVERVNA